MEVESVEGTVALLPEDAVVNKILCMCNPACILQIEEDLKGISDSINRKILKLPVRNYASWNE